MCSFLTVKFHPTFPPGASSNSHITANSILHALPTPRFTLPQPFLTTAFLIFLPSQTLSCKLSPRLSLLFLNHSRTPWSWFYRDRNFQPARFLHTLIFSFSASFTYYSVENSSIVSCILHDPSHLPFFSVTTLNFLAGSSQRRH